MISRSIDWLTDWLIDGLMDWLTDWLTDWLIDWWIMKSLLFTGVSNFAPAVVICSHSLSFVKLFSTQERDEVSNPFHFVVECQEAFRENAAHRGCRRTHSCLRVHQAGINLFPKYQILVCWPSFFSVKFTVRFSNAKRDRHVNPLLSHTHQPISKKFQSGNFPTF